MTKTKILLAGVAGIVATNFGVTACMNHLEAERAAMSPAERLEEERRILASRAEDRAQRAATNLREHRDGQHCLSGWSGEHPELADMLKAQLREPDSYEHIRTAIMPVDDRGEHTLVMRYRARNGFGGMGVATVIAQDKNADCSFRITNSRVR